MICERNSDNKYGFISLILRHLHLLFKQWMLPEKKSGFCSQHDKRFMQLRQRDILGNYAEKNGGTARIALLINSPFVRKVTGRVAQMRDRVACPWSQYKNSPATKPFVREQRQINICTKYQHTEIDFLLFLLFFDESSWLSFFRILYYK